MPLKNVDRLQSVCEPSGAGFTNQNNKNISFGGGVPTLLLVGQSLLVRKVLSSAAKYLKIDFTKLILHSNKKGFLVEKW